MDFQYKPKNNLVDYLEKERGILFLKDDHPIFRKGFYGSGSEEELKFLLDLAEFVWFEKNLPLVRKTCNDVLRITRKSEKPKHICCEEDKKVIMEAMDFCIPLFLNKLNEFSNSYGVFCYYAKRVGDDYIEKQKNLLNNMEKVISSLRNEYMVKFKPFIPKFEELSSLFNFKDILSPHLQIPIYKSLDKLCESVDSLKELFYSKEGGLNDDIKLLRLLNVDIPSNIKLLDLKSTEFYYTGVFFLENLGVSKELSSSWYSIGREDNSSRTLKKLLKELREN